MGRPSRFSPEVRERAVRMVEEHRATHASEWGVLQSVAPKLGCTAETLRKWVRQAQRDAGYRPGLTTSERERLKELEREVRELKRANEILRKASERMLPRRSSTAAGSDGSLHSRPSGSVRGRAGSAPCCRSPPRRITAIGRRRSIRRVARPGHNAMLRCARRFSGCMTSSIRCTGRARSGNSCVAQGAAWHDARWVG